MEIVFISQSLTCGGRTREEDRNTEGCDNTIVEEQRLRGRTEKTWWRRTQQQRQRSGGSAKREKGARRNS
ncbi:hypothetical protein SESBI_51040 [Sesbania bispinosa]|nr:hypothetical protein SESBI_51040 [Sesbania bispinosa]